MARPFIGEDGFYPDWVKGGCRWVTQRVLIITGSGMLRELDTLARPPVSHESLIWVPRRRWSDAILPFESGSEGSRALEELKRIPVVCSECEWAGYSPSIQTDPRTGPSQWRLRCPDCYSRVDPDVDFLNVHMIIERWKEKGAPKLDPPGAARSITSIAPIINLEDWFESFKPMVNEIAYVGQQLWPNFAEFVHDALGSNPQQPQW